ncbi:hypothetical protein DFP72DRAFT_753753, partial [Ephemerocybe angulata]
MLIWIICALTPQQVRDRLMAKDSEFTREIIAYLEGAQTGDFFTGSLDDMKAKYPDARPPDLDPTQLLPVPPPTSRCPNPSSSCICEDCEAFERWTEQYQNRVDHVLYRTNVHTCFVKRNVVVDGSQKQLIVGKGCLNKDRVCTARFPRNIFKETEVDKDGHISLKKKESYINTVNDTMVYCYGCNTDCTSLSSGTAIKATAGYIADYICKMGLKTYQIFSSIYDVFER